MADSKRTKRISLALTPEEDEALREAADEEDRAHSKYARLAVMRAVERDLRRRSPQPHQQRTTAA